MNFHALKFDIQKNYFSKSETFLTSLTVKNKNNNVKFWNCIHSAFIEVKLAYSIM